ncbi:PepSY domain-containing protein [Paenibacillus polymyxa]|uniref:PepSY domain-containing protein n=1 Tax=Paenibacillus polymyxa TaxID=1406 RepID=UPI00287FA855|nr:PepSY domain-containing protein [Paenibacillus polymyxa]
MSSKLDKEDGQFIYEVKVLTNEGTVELEIHASSGAIVDTDEDDDDNEYESPRSIIRVTKIQS